MGMSSRVVSVVTYLGTQDPSFLDTARSLNPGRIHFLMIVISQKITTSYILLKRWVLSALWNSSRLSWSFQEYYWCWILMAGLLLKMWNNSAKHYTISQDKTLMWAAEIQLKSFDLGWVNSQLAKSNTNVLFNNFWLHLIVLKIFSETNTKRNLYDNQSNQTGHFLSRGFSISYLVMSFHHFPPLCSFFPTIYLNVYLAHLSSNYHFTVYCGIDSIFLCNNGLSCRMASIFTSSDIKMPVACYLFLQHSGFLLVLPSCLLVSHPVYRQP